MSFWVSSFCSSFVVSFLKLFVESFNGTAPPPSGRTLPHTQRVNACVASSNYSNSPSQTHRANAVIMQASPLTPQCMGLRSMHCLGSCPPFCTNELSTSLLDEGELYHPHPERHSGQGAKVFLGGGGAFNSERSLESKPHPLHVHVATCVVDIFDYQPTNIPDILK